MSRERSQKIRPLNVLVPRGERGKWVGVAMLGVLVAMFESVAAVLVAVLVDTLGGTGGESLDLPLVGDPADWLPGADEENQIFILAVAIGLFFVVKAVLTVVQTYTESRVAQNTGARIADRLFSGYLAMPYPFHVSHNSAELMGNASWASDEVVSSYLNPLTSIISQTAMVGFMFAVLIATAPMVTLVTIGVIVPLALLSVRVVRRALHRYGGTTRDKINETLASLQEGLHGIREIKVLGRERFFSSEFRELRSELARSRYMYPTVASIPSVSIETVLLLFIVGVVAVSGSAGGTAASLPLLGLFAYAGLRIVPAISRLVQAMNRIQYGRTAVEVVSTNMQLIDEQAQTLPEGNAEPLQFAEAIVLTEVSFSYETGPRVLESIDLTIEPGQSIGIVGSTGAGKSTLLDIILGLLTPTEGTVQVDGTNLEDTIRSWHATIGLVPQTIYLLDDTIRANIAYGLKTDDSDESRVVEATQRAQLNSFIETLPDGLDTQVGERGIRVSGGQRQRVAIARALYSEPQVLIFDEGTASLDNLTEAALLRALEELRGDRTIITVAHRLTTVRSCDRIILLDQGRIVDQGTYAELQSRNATFQEMAG